MKGVILKRFKDDFTYSREIFGYNYFRDCGVWTAPRAGYTRLLLDIVEEDGSIEKVDYGVYAMIENIDKQFLKERTSEEKGGDFNGNKGNLWKCTWKNGSGPNFRNDYEDYYFGVEEIKLDPSEPSFEYNYDLKTNKDKLDKAKTEIKGWINELNSLNDSDSSAIKAWYEEKMDVDLFLKTYAVNVILGMWDDYWINNNNYYFYFDKDGKAYFIPYDYDNILGTNGCSTDAAKKNPLEWGNLNDGNHPLIQKIMKVPEFVNKYKEYLIQFSNAESGFDYTKASAKIRTWQNMIKDYIGATAYTDGVCKLAWENTKGSFEDVVADWSSPKVDYKLLEDNEYNYFKVRQNVIEACINPKECHLTFDTGDGEVSYFYDSTFGNVKDLNLKFSSGAKFGTITENYGFSGYNGALAKCFRCWLYEGKIVDSDTSFYNDARLIAKWNSLYEVTFDLNGGTYTSGELGSCNFLEEFDVSDFHSGYMKKDGFWFGGWTYTKDGDDLVTSLDRACTVYARWIEPLYTCVGEGESRTFTFTFRPEDYNCGIFGDNVYIMCDASGWKTNASYKMTKQENGWYTISLKDLGSWHGFKFYCNDWIGYEQFRYRLSEDCAEHSGDKNFLVKELKR